MVLNVSGRTDIVAFYTPWFIRRYEEGFVDVRNPMFPKKVSRIYFNDVELIIFCTKNPKPIIPYLKKIKQPIIFQVTLTPYKKDIEPNVDDKKKIIEEIKEISKIVGIDNLYVRYDPILLNNNYSVDYHVKAFKKICNLLNGYVKHIIISFIDDYKNVNANAHILKLKEFIKDDYQRLGLNFGRIAKECGMEVQTCFEDMDLTEYGILNVPCLSRELAFKKTGKYYKKWSARKCDCVEMVDIGVYNSCNHLCKYCYANYNEKKVCENIQLHDINSTMLLGHLEVNDEVIIRKNK